MADPWLQMTFGKRNGSRRFPNERCVATSSILAFVSPNQRRRCLVLSSLVGLLMCYGEQPVEGFDTVWRTKKEYLTDREAYGIVNKFGDRQLPEVTPRQCRGFTFSFAFSSPGCAIISHVKIGKASIKPFAGPEQL